MKPGRNDPCSCGSGKKYKNCCLGKTEFRPPPSLVPAPAELNQLDALFNTGRYSELESRARLLLGPYPNSGLVWKLFGLSLQMQGKDALRAMRSAAELLPHDAEAHANLAAALRASGQLEEAVTAGRRALKINPDFAEAHNNLGVALQDLGQLNDAVASYRRAISIKPGFAEAHNNLGSALKELGQIDNGLASYSRALEINPDFAKARSNFLQVLNSSTNYSVSSGLAQAQQYGHMAARKVSSPFSAWHCITEPERLRVGMVSGDLNNHPVGYFLEGLLAQLDYTRIELIAYPTSPVMDELTARIKPYYAAWKPLSGLSDNAAAHLIHADGVHVLLDLSGHTHHNRLPVFAWRPSPVQASWLGYFATTGVAEMDYVLADPYVVPSGEEGQFTEAIWRLPESYFCFTPPKSDVDVLPLPALATGRITFGCFNNLAKMNDAVVALWARVLHAVPGSRLFLKTKQLNDAMVCNIIRQRYAERGVLPDRLVLEGSSPRAELLAAYNKVDIALDPFPYPGGTTSVEALWMGVPVITRRGDRFLSHVGETIAQNAGMADWIAADDDEYVAKAVEHAADLQRLADLRAGLRQQVLASPVYDAPRFARNFEAAVRGMWETKRDQQKMEKT
jgi:protein O-GlcNAc transferase